MSYDSRSPRPLEDSAMSDSTRGGPVRNEGNDLHYTRRFFYGLGHVFNDLCASMWFTYFILFYHLVLRISNAYAGLLVLIGQLADAMTTPVAGYLCDKTENWYGGRKTWHLVGTVMVACSVFFFWHECLDCSDQPVGYQILYFSCFIIVFQMGWAIVQVSHLALIPELTTNESIRVELNSIRYAFTILSNSGVFIAMLILLAVINKSPNGNSTQINPNDQWIFSGVALGIIVVGLLFSAAFHIGTREPRSHRGGRDSQGAGKKLPWFRWFLNPQFYFLSAAIVPLVIFFSGFIATIFLRLINKLLGRYLVYFIGLVVIWLALLWFRFWPEYDGQDHGHNHNNETSHGTLPHMKITENLIYGAAVLTGVGGTTLLVTSLSMVADLIGDKCESSAFVYGAMSFSDKLSSGIAIQIIQILHPCKGMGDKVCCPGCVPYYRNVLTYVPAGASVIAFLALVVVVIMVLIKKGRAVTTPCDIEDRRHAIPHQYTIQKHDSNTSSASIDERAPLINKRK